LVTEWSEKIKEEDEEKGSLPASLVSLILNVRPSVIDGETRTSRHIDTHHTAHTNGSLASRFSGRKLKEKRRDLRRKKDMVYLPGIWAVRFVSSRRRGQRPERVQWAIGQK